MVCNGLLALLLATPGCGKPVFPSELFTIDAEGADYPFMLSETKAGSGKRGRPVSAQSGTSASYSQSSYTAGNTRVTVTHTTAAKSELPAATKLAAQVRRADRWVQLESATLTATDFATYGSSSTDRLLVIDATVHK